MKKIIKIFILLLILLPLGVFAKDNEVTLYFFYGKECPHCHEEQKYLNKISNKYKKLKIKKYEVWYNKDNAELLQKVLEKYNIERNATPTTIIGSSCFIGYSEGADLTFERAINYYNKNEYHDYVKDIINNKEIAKIEDKFSEYDQKNNKKFIIDVPIIGKVNLKRFSLFTSTTLIALVDGFNPCAMWILLFLISILLGMKDRRRMWIIGLTFLISSALVYMAIMLSWLNIVINLTEITFVRYIIGLIAIIGGIINLRSFKNAKDSGCEIVDDKKRKKIFTKIKKFTEEKSLFLALIGVITLAISVNVVELACSAGLPLIFTELLVINNITGVNALLYTLLYIIFFLFDDILVFVIAMKTLKITTISTKYNKYSHLVGGIIMLLIGILLILKPEIIMFNI